MLSSKKRVPFSVTHFSDLYSDEYFYVDKTEMIAKLAREKGHFFLARPRRFGKTTLIKTFDTLFSQGLYQFAGLKICQYSKEELNLTKTYPVLHLSFALLRDYYNKNNLFYAVADVERSLIRYLADFFAKLNITIDKESTSAAQSLAYALNQLDQEIVILIDEYDVPLIAAFDNIKAFVLLQKIFSDFYNVINRYKAKLRFVFITGVSRSLISLFTGYEALVDISYHKDYSSILGFTVDEILKDFKEPLFDALYELDYKVLDKPVKEIDELVTGMQQTYGGFYFDEKAEQEILYTGSVVGFLNSPYSDITNYWSSAGAFPSYLMNYIKLITKKIGTDAYTFIPEKDLIIDKETLISPVDLEEVSIESLIKILFQVGFYSFKKPYEDTDENKVHIGITNPEIEDIFDSVILEYLKRDIKG